jgi:hypothetical protein
MNKITMVAGAALVALAAAPAMPRRRRSRW